MQIVWITLLAALPAFAQDVEVAVRPDVVYVEAIGGNIAPMERVFFHIVIDNQSRTPIDVQWVRFDMTNSKGVVFSTQYLGSALIDLFDSSIDRKRIEPTPKQTLNIVAGQRKSISDIFFDFPKGFIGENLVVEVDYKTGGTDNARKVSVPMNRTAGFSGRLPFDGTWYVAAEHGFLDAHKRFLAEAFAYDFVQIGANSKSFVREGKNNADYYAYGKKVLAAKAGTVVETRNDIAENTPGETTNVNTSGGNVVIIDHGNNQYGYYAHLKPFSIAVKRGAKVREGEVLGEVGNSGDSFEPHLHFHVMNGPDAAQADGIPVVFENWKAQSHGRNPVVRQQGVLPRGEFVQP
jgi:murein DD-endopeptidase MepM/ murein hydrolase activator NlpD